MKAIINGRVILKDRVAEGLAVLFSDVIEGVIPQENIPQGVKAIDARGGFVAPGLIDLHIHGFSGRDVCEGTVDAIKTIARGLLSGGVTAFLPTTMTVGLQDIKTALSVCRELKEQSRDWQGSAILGCHAEGPFINPLRKGAQEEKHILKPDSDFVKEYADIIKILSLAPETDSDDFGAIKDICRNTDVVVSMGHTNASCEQGKAAINAGVAHATHLFNAMSGLDHKAPGAAAAALNSDISCELIADGIHVSAAYYDMVWRLKGRKLCFITDCLSAGGLEIGEYTLGGQKIIYDGTICRLTDGTIAGSALSLNRGVWNVFTNSSIPLYECVNCASLNPACVLGVDDKKGSIEKGKDADIIITDSNFNISKTIIGGKIKYEC